MSKRPVLLALVAGVLLWIIAAVLSGRREPWDGAAYWVFAYPMALLAAASLGWYFPLRPWRWATLLFLGQFIGMVLRNGEPGNLWPLGLIAFLLLSVPAVAIAAVAARMRRRRLAESDPGSG